MPVRRLHILDDNAEAVAQPFIETAACRRRRAISDQGKDGPEADGRTEIAKRVGGMLREMHDILALGQIVDRLAQIEAVIVEGGLSRMILMALFLYWRSPK